MNVDENLIKNACNRIVCESKFYKDSRLTEQEQEFVNKVVEEIVDNAYTIKYTNAPSARVDDQERYAATETVKNIVRDIFKDFPGAHIPFVRAAHQTLIAHHSTFTEMIKAKLVPEDKKDREEIKETFKNYIATYISKFFEDVGKPGGFLIRDTGEYIKHRNKRIALDPLEKEFPEIKGTF